MKTIFALIFGVLAAQPALAQEDGTYGGSITTGYRFTDVKGYEPKYQELFDLNSGLRLLGLNLLGDAKTRYLDRYSLTVYGIGGEPYSSAQLNLHKKRVYDLRVNFRQTHYYWNRNDQAPLPNGFHSLTNYHDWATVRKIGSVNLLVHATNNLRFSFEYARNTRDGVTGTTRPIDYFGSSATWGYFARANPYYIVAPLTETTNRVTAGIDYTRRAWTVHYRLGYQRFEDAINSRNASALERSINVDDPSTAKELVSAATWSDSRRLSTPVSEFSYTGNPLSRLEMRGGYIFYRYSGPASLDFAFSGVARTNSTGTTLAPYSISASNTASVTEPNHVIDQGFTYTAKEWWRLMLDYRYSRFSVESEGHFRTAGDVVASGAASDSWRAGTHVLNFDSVFTPTSTLLLRAGVRLMKSDIEARSDGVIDVNRTKRINTVWPILSGFYQPSKMLSVRADIEQTNNGTSYTRITPHIDKGGRVVVRFRPVDKFYLDNTSVVRNRELLQTDYHSKVRSNAVTANYELNERFTVFAGFSYDSMLATDFVNFVRGTAPITNIGIRDQTVERVWHGGINATPYRGVSVSFSGNFLRATGVGEIAGESPLYGPMSFPYATASIHYDVPRFGRMALQLQRTYYSEQIVPGNNFSANLLTIAWTRSFGK